MSGRLQPFSVQNKPVWHLVQFDFHPGCKHVNLVDIVVAVAPVHDADDAAPTE